MERIPLRRAPVDQWVRPLWGGGLAAKDEKQWVLLLLRRRRCSLSLSVCLSSVSACMMDLASLR